MCFVPQRRALFWHFFDIWTSKSGPRPSVFNTFDFEMCFAPQRRALFRHLNFQKWSDHGVLCTFWLGNVLRATTACTFSTSQLPKVVRSWCALCILTWNVLCATTACNFSSLLWPAGSAPAALASLLFDPPEPQIIGKTQCFATFLPFRASVSSVLLLFLFSDLLSSNLSLLSASAQLCFSSVHIVGSLTSKLPSIIYYNYRIPSYFIISSLTWTLDICDPPWDSIPDRHLGFNDAGPVPHVVPWISALPSSRRHLQRSSLVASPRCSQHDAMVILCHKTCHMDSGHDRIIIHKIT